MALVSIPDAAKLVRKARATLMRDIENGRLAKTVLQDGDVRIDTAELLRAYGRLHSPQAAATPRESRKTAADKTRIALLEERIRSLERVIVLEAELRRVKDQVTTELRARLADKDHLIRILESKILFLEYDKQTQQTQQTRQVPTLQPDQPAPIQSAKPAGRTATAAPSATAATAATATTAAAADKKIAASAAPAKAAVAGGTAGTPDTAGTPGATGAVGSVATAPTATTASTPATSARTIPGAPGGRERRHPPASPRGWWRRIFGGGEPRNH